MFNNNNKTILLTGTAGFIGSNFVPYFLEKYPNYNLVSLDQLAKSLPNYLKGLLPNPDEIIQRLENLFDNKKVKE